MRGLSAEDKRVRYELFNYNMDAVTRLMTESKYPQPVGLIIDTSDKYGKIISEALMDINGLPANTNSKLIDTCIDAKAIPTMLTALPLDTAKKVLAITSPTAEENLSKPLPQRTYWVIAIGRGGNSYAGVQINSI